MMLMQTYSWGATPDHIIEAAVLEECHGDYVAEFNDVDADLVRRVSPASIAAAPLTTTVDGKWVVHFTPKTLLQLLKDLRSAALLRLQRLGTFGPEAALRSDILSTIGVEEI